MTTAEYLRKHMPPNIPWAIRELLIANVRVGNYTAGRAADLAGFLSKALKHEQEVSK